LKKNKEESETGFVLKVKTKNKNKNKGYVMYYKTYQSHVFV